MKQIGYGFLVVLLLLPASMLKAQKPLDHEKQIYVSPEGRLYIQKSMPVYLRISTSPDEEADSYLLKSDEGSEYSNPMYFDTEGWNTVRSPSAVDTSTKKTVYPLRDIIFEVYADSRPPSTRLNIPEVKPFVRDGERYYGKEIRIELSSRDALSGTEEIYYSLNGQPYKPYEEPISCEEEKEYVLKYYAIDHVRNIEKPASFKFHLDMSAPQTQYSIEGNSKDNILGKDAAIKLSSEDSLSGVKEIRYSINEGTEQTYNKEIPVSLFQEQNNTLVYYAIDHLNNREEKQSLSSSVEKSRSGSDNGDGTFSYYIDKDPPQVELQIKGDQYKGKYLFVSERSEVELTAKDEKSGVEEITYSINNSGLSNVYEGSFKLEEQGLRYLNYAALDQVGNQSPRKNQAIYKDTDSPATTFSYEGSHYKNRDTLFVKADTKFTISGEDTESGLQKIMYRIDDQNEQEYSEPIYMTEPGINDLTFYGMDQVNNREENHQLKIYVDREAPSIYPHFSVESIGTKIVRGEEYVIYPSNSRLYIGATDRACGTDYIKYRINEGEFKRELPIQEFEPGNYVVEIYAYDHLNNEKVRTLRFAIEH